MKRNKLLVLWMLCLVLPSLLSLVACSNADSVSDDSADTKKFGSMEFVVFADKDKMVTLGSDDEKAKTNEKPSMDVVLDYRFYIGKNEVTCGDFRSVLKDYDAYANLPDCESDSLPVVNVSYFDAVLFANEMSKRQGYDTAYTYAVASFGEEGCSGLSDLKFDPTVDAFRLPTEAEWVYAAGIGWNTENAWTSRNAGNTLHAVCSLPESAAGLCDMAGNAMEWVNDWLGNFKDTLVVNYVGATDGGPLGERVLKGGSYRQEPSTVGLVTRGDVYTTTSASRTNYVGFRLAFGNIPAATWFEGTEKPPVGGGFSSLVMANTVRSLTRTFKTKFAFRNDVTGNLAYIDYSVAGYLVHEIADTMQVYHPDISPDGMRVAFCTGLEGVSGKSALYVRDLDDSGTGLVKLDVESAAIPRWRVLENGDTVIVYVSDAGNNKDESSFRAKSTWQVKFSGGKFGEPQKLFDGAYHGGISDDGRLAVTGARLLRARIAKAGANTYTDARDTVWYNGEQACNASLSKDGSKRTAFLDFASATGREFVGESYAVHERLLVMDSTGALVASVAAPSGYSFDHTEWAIGRTSSTPNLLVATLVNTNGAHEKVALVDLSSGKVTEILKGEEIWHPCVWVKSTSVIDEDTGLSPDSAGVYYVAQGSAAAASIRVAMENLWKFRDSADLVILGSSRPQAGLDPGQIKNAFAVNLSNVPNSLFVSDYLFENYVLLHMKKVKYLVISLDIDMWFKTYDNDYDNFFYKEYRNYPGYVYDENHDYWSDGYPEGLLEMTENAPEPYNKQYMPTRGYHVVECEDWAEPTTDYDVNWCSLNPALLNANMLRLVEIIRSAREKNVTVIGIVFPQNPEYRSTEAYGRYGLTHAEAQNIVDALAAYQEEYPNFILMDEHKMGNHDYGPDMAFNMDHLCKKGASQLTARLDSLLGTLE